MKNFYISDLHLGHKNVLKFDNRPFQTVEEMNDTIIKNWNDTVSDKDTVYILGDFSWAGSEKTKEFLKQLKGNKILIKGNHDHKNIKNNTSSKEYFADIVDYLEIKDNDRFVVLSHYPIPCFNRHYYGSYHLYGHVHNGLEFGLMEKYKHEIETDYNIPCNMYNVGCMMPWMDYKPRTLDEIIKGYDNKTERKEDK